MPCTRILVALSALTLALTACGGQDGTSHTAAPSTVPPTTTTLPPETTATTPPPATTTSTAVTTTSTTTAPTTTTLLAPAVPVVGWDGEGIRDLRVEIAFDPPIPALVMASVARQDLSLLGIAIVESSDHVLAFALEGNALSDSYGSAGICYTGARVGGTVALTAPGRPDLDTRFSGEVPTAPVVTLSCEKDPDYAPFGDAFEKGILMVATDFWGAAAAPLLVAVVEREVGTSAIDLALKAVAMDEFRALEPEGLSFEHRRAMLEAAVEVVAYLVDTGYTPHGADRAARRLLTSYSGTDFGAATPDDVGEWRAWLEGWVAQGGS
jgi:hypothetical protein